MNKAVKVLRSPNTTAVVAGIAGTLATIHPTYAPTIGLLMTILAPFLPGYIKPNPPAAPKAE
jgi:hypothetical protein